MADSSDVVVIATYVRRVEGEGRFAVPQQVAAWIDAVARRRKTVVVAFGNPYVIRQFPAVNSYIVTYGVGDDLERGAAGALLGNQKITGRVPVSLPGFFKAGDGIQR
jgi:beta-N-acetylhexosaminidase